MGLIGLMTLLPETAQWIIYLTALCPYIFKRGVFTGGGGDAEDHDQGHVVQPYTLHPTPYTLHSKYEPASVPQHIYVKWLFSNLNPTTGHRATRRSRSTPRTCSDLL